MPRAWQTVDVYIPLLFTAALALLLAGNTALLAGAPRGGTITQLLGAFVFAIAALTVLVADLSARGAAHAAPPHGADDEGAVARALDFPGAWFIAVSSIVFVAQEGLFVASVYGVGGAHHPAVILLLVNASLVVLGNALGLAAEAQRTVDVAVLAAAAAHDAPHLCAVVAAHEAAHGGLARAPAGPRLLSCGPPAPARPPVTARACCRAAGHFVLPSTIFNLLGALLLLAGGVLLAADAERAALATLEVCFSVFLVGLALIFAAGARRVAAHRRGGRAHLEADVRRALSRAPPRLAEAAPDAAVRRRDEL